ncbi:MAG TPA: serine hydrolase domain-containing protein [Alphaproteobacteria bacterium]|nr:serine hydrolase domain-containing protein [Alphaproteobacteria bacterium]
MPERFFGPAIFGAALLTLSPALADQTAKMPNGVTYTIPDGMTAVSHDNYVSLELPDGSAHFVIIPVPKAGSPRDAADAAWRIYAPKRAMKPHTDEPRRDHYGWDEQRFYGYETAPSEHRMIQARAFRKDSGWTVTIIDADEAATEKHDAALTAAILGLRAPDFRPEILAGRAANRLDAVRTEALKGFVDNSMRLVGAPGAAMALVDHGHVVFEGGFGVRAMGKPDPVDANTLFLAGSTTKSLTTLLMAKLIDEGRLRWDQPVVSLYPTFALGTSETSRKVLIRHLVCACTGVPRKDYEFTLNAHDNTPQSVFTMLAATDATTDFGAAFQYSNQMVAAAGYVAAHAADPGDEIGAAYDMTMQREIFAPLGMVSTTFDMKKALAGDHAAPHGQDVDNHTAPVDMDAEDVLAGIRPAGGIWTSAHDMAKYVQLELAQGAMPDGQRLVSAKNLLERRVPGAKMGPEEFYGLGLHIDNSAGVRVVDHYGAVSGFRAAFYFLPDADVGAVLLVNADRGELMLDTFKRRLLEVLFEGREEAAPDLANFNERMDIRARSDRAAIAVPADLTAAGKLAGRYGNADLGTITVTHAGRDTVFDFGLWKSEVASRLNPDGTVTFLTIRPAKDGLEFTAGEKDGKRTLLTSDAQHDYLYTESGPDGGGLSVKPEN